MSTSIHEQTDGDTLEALKRSYQNSRSQLEELQRKSNSASAPERHNIRHDNPEDGSIYHKNQGDSLDQKLREQLRGQPSAYLGKSQSPPKSTGAFARPSQSKRISPLRKVVAASYSRPNSSELQQPNITYEELLDEVFSLKAQLRDDHYQIVELRRNLEYEKSTKRNILSRLDAMERKYDALLWDYDIDIRPKSSENALRDIGHNAPYRSIYDRQYTKDGEESRFQRYTSNLKGIDVPHIFKPSTMKDKSHYLDNYSHSQEFTYNGNSLAEESTTRLLNMTRPR